MNKLRYLWDRRRLERELEEEMAFHAEQSGQSFGDITRWRERSQDEWGFRPLEELWQDLRYATRSLRRQPGFAIAAFLLLALGVAANTAIFSVVRAVMLSSLPVRDAGSLVQLGYHDAAENEFRPGHTHVAYEMFAKDRSVLRDAFGFSSPLEVNAIANGSSVLVSAQAVTPNAFEVLGLDRTLGQQSVMLTHGYWQRRFGGDSGVVGRTLIVNAVPFTVAGVLPRGFRGLAVGEKPDLFFHADRVNEVLMRNLRNPGNMWLRIIARLQAGVSLQQAQATLQPMGTRGIEDVYAALPPGMVPEIRKVLGGFEFRVIPAAGGAQSELRDSLSTALIVLLASAGLLLFVACANLAGLALARSIARQREFGIRVALGCGRGRLIRQLLSESLLIAVAAGCAALLVEPIARRVLLSMLTDEGVITAPLDGPVIAFLLGVTLLAGVLVGLVPGWRVGSRVHVVEDRMAQSPRMTRFLIVAQVAMSLILIAGAGMFAQTFRSYRNVEPGYRRDHLITVAANPGTLRYGQDKLLTYYRSALDGVRQVPGVVSATISRWPMGQLSWTTLAQVDAISDRTARNLAGPNFAATFGLRLAAGRDLTQIDVSRRTALINESFKRRYFGSRDAVGQTFALMDATDKPFEIVGVVADARDRGPKHSNRPTVYTAWENDRMGWLTFNIRTDRDPASTMAEIRAALKAVDSAVPIGEMRTAEDQLDNELRRERMMAALGIAFGALALSVAAVGLYALLAHTVARRTREIGVRVAIGASRGSVVRLVFRQCAVLVIAGVVVGLPLAVTAGSAVRNQLYGVEPGNALLLGIATAVMIVVAIVAAALPAWRAAQIDPVLALRHE